jgi:hypothetical protein
MKLIGFLVIAIGLTLGAIGASTAYLAKLTLPDDRLVGQQLAEPVWPKSQPRPDAAGDPEAGAPIPEQPPQPEQAEIQPAEEAARRQAEAGAALDEEAALDEQVEAAAAEAAPAEPQPIAPADAEITPELLAEMRAAGVEYIRVKSFAFARWEGKWNALAGILGLIIGAALVRVAGRQDAAADVARAAEGDAPESLMEQAREELLALSRQAAGERPGPQRAHLIMQRVGEIQRARINPVIEGRGRLRARLGLAGYARVMDRFAAAERQVNRAWSAAADGDDEEAMACLARGAESLAEARERLTG